MKKILITGGFGFIGYFLVKKHLELGHKVIVFDSFFKNKGRIDREFKKVLSHENLKLIKIDLTKEIKRNFVYDKIDLVYHLAAINGTELFYKIPYKVATDNLLITINLLKFFEKIKISKIIYSSTSEVYSDGFKLNLIKIPTDETAPIIFTQPTDTRYSYGASKFMCEFLVKEFGKKFHLNTLIIRYHNIYGPRMGTKHVIPQITNRILSGERPLKVFGANETRAFCFVDDAVEATYKLGLKKIKNGEIIHIGNDKEEIKIKKLVLKILKMLNKKIKLKLLKGKSSSVKRRCPNIKKLHKITGFKPITNLDEGLRKTINWYLNQQINF
jgi:nucleoside-diphosphate-sugar epimerase